MSTLQMKEKSQGFERAKLMRRGVFECLYDCGQWFLSKAEERSHVKSCPVKKKVFRELDRMAENRAGFQQPNTLQLRHDENEEFRKFLSSLPTLNRMELLWRSVL